MIGIVVVSHGRLAYEFVNVTTDIVGKGQGLVAVGIDRSMDVDLARTEIEKAVKEVDQGDGVVIFTDMFGGTPSNLGLSFLEESKVEVVSGVNLPMLIKASTARDGKSLNEFAAFIKGYGGKSISLASEILNSKGTK